MYLISCCIDFFQKRNSPKSDKTRSNLLYGWTMFGKVWKLSQSVCESAVEFTILSEVRWNVCVQKTFSQQVILWPSCCNDNNVILCCDWDPHPPCIMEREICFLLKILLHSHWQSIAGAARHTLFFGWKCHEESVRQKSITKTFPRINSIWVAKNTCYHITVVWSWKFALWVEVWDISHFILSYIQWECQTVTAILSCAACIT